MKKRMVMIANGPRYVWLLAAGEAGTVGEPGLLLVAIVRAVRTRFLLAVERGDGATERQEARGLRRG